MLCCYSEPVAELLKVKKWDNRIKSFLKLDLFFDEDWQAENVRRIVAWHQDKNIHLIQIIQQFFFNQDVDDQTKNSQEFVEILDTDSFIYNQ